MQSLIPPNPYSNQQFGASYSRSGEARWTAAVLNRARERERACLEALRIFLWLYFEDFLRIGSGGAGFVARIRPPRLLLFPPPSTSWSSAFAAPISISSFAFSASSSPSFDFSSQICSIQHKFKNWSSVFPAAVQILIVRLRRADLDLQFRLLCIVFSELRFQLADLLNSTQIQKLKLRFVRWRSSCNWEEDESKPLS